MGAFFLVLIGGIFALGKILQENTERAKAEDDFEKHRDLAKRLGTFLDSTPYERQVIDNLVNVGYLYNEVYDRLKDDLTEMFGNDFREKFPLPGSPYPGPSLKGDPNPTKAIFSHNTAAYLAKELLLSKNGKLYQSPSYGKYDIGHPPQQFIKVYKKIERNLNETAGKKPGCPEIKFANKARYGKKSDGTWDLSGSYLTLAPYGEYKYLW